MKRTTLYLLLCAWGTHLIAQSFATPDSNYIKLVEAAFVHLEKGDCQPCLDAYEAAFKISERSVLSRLRAALCAYACKNEARFQYHMQFAAEKDMGVFETVLESGYPEFDAYRETDFYKKANAYIDTNNEKAGFNMALRKELAQIEKDDQQLRGRVSDKSLTEAQKQDIWRTIQELDSINLIKISAILDKYGYPGKTMVGEKYSGTAWLVLQHSNLESMKKYYKMLEEASNKGELRKSSFALFIDRYRMWSGEKQLYGSQVKTDPSGKPSFHPIEDEENVNKRRAEMDLGPLEEYAKHFGFEYVVPVKKQ